MSLEDLAAREAGLPAEVEEVMERHRGALQAVSEFDRAEDWPSEAMDWARRSVAIIAELRAEVERLGGGFKPNWSSPPSETIVDAMIEKGMCLAELLRLLDLTIPQWFEGYCNGSAAITANLAERLADVLGGNPKFWLTREAQYRAAEARLYGEVKR